MRKFMGLVVLVLLGSSASRAAIVITEIHPSGSAATNNTYHADWFEVTNTAIASVDITGWKVDDNSNAFASAVAIRGITSIPGGASVVLMEGAATNVNDATLQTAFIHDWFGGTAPNGFLIGFYGGTSVGLSGTADAVNVFDSGGTTIARDDFGASTTGVTFDNTVGLNNVTLTQLSVDGANGAFTSNSGLGLNEIGSPGAVPEPSSVVLALLAACGLAGRRRRRQ